MRHLNWRFVESWWWMCHSSFEEFSLWASRRSWNCGSKSHFLISKLFFSPNKNKKKWSLQSPLTGLKMTFTHYHIIQCIFIKNIWFFVVWVCMNQKTINRSLKFFMTSSIIDSGFNSNKTQFFFWTNRSLCSSTNALLLRVSGSGMFLKWIIFYSVQDLRKSSSSRFWEGAVTSK